MPNQIPVYINPFDCAKRGVVFTGEIKVNEFKRLHEVIHGFDATTTFKMVLNFDTDRAGDARLTGTIKGQVILICQRCLHDLDFNFEIPLNHILCANQASLDRHKKSDTIFSVDDEKVRVVDIIEDEILLEIPTIPKHQKLEDCKGLEQYLVNTGTTNEETEKVNNPFAVLKDKLH